MGGMQANLNFKYHGELIFASMVDYDVKLKCEELFYRL